MQALESTNRICPLCTSPSSLWSVDAPTRAIRAGHVRAREYFRCSVCGLIHVAPENRPTPEEERQRYLEHENAGADYRVYLNRFLDHALGPGDGAGSRVLDYGCGPAPALGAVLRERGYQAAGWDPFFAADPAVLSETYDTVVLHEVLEHIAEPREAIREIAGLLAPGGRIVIRTQPYPEDPEAFAHWWYRADPTHLCFYRAQPIATAARLIGLGLAASRDDIFVIR